ncbi:LysE family translocator [Pseudomonas syringae]|nr:LysE family translocator [Pseudomonas syringae]MBD8789414.1 LysE family translocator [Pseudomonas syringae]MBD8800162.1 LysE family translocator [Pseudomonas syringae]MBD8810842.1 LysE family translocator [Pseudomonas syringae]
MNIALTLTYALTVLLLIATPGPVVALVLHTASRAGARQAATTALGSNAGSLVLIGVAAWLIVNSVALDPGLLTLLSLLGCLYIAWTALTLLHASACVAPACKAGPGGWRRGFMVGVCNPKDILFFVAFFPQFVHVTASLEASLIMLSLVWVAIDLGVLGAWILFAGTLVRRVGSRWISRGAGSALLLIALAGLVYNLRRLA